MPKTVCTRSVLKTDLRVFEEQERSADVWEEEIMCPQCLRIMTLQKDGNTGQKSLDDIWFEGKLSDQYRWSDEMTVYSSQYGSMDPRLTMVFSR